MHHDSLWRILQHSYQLPEKLLIIIQTLHEDSTAAVRAYGKISDKFPVTCGVRQDCVLAPTLFNLYFDVAIHMEHRMEGKSFKVAYLHNADLMGNWKTLILVCRWQGPPSWQLVWPRLHAGHHHHLLQAARPHNQLLPPEGPDVQYPAPIQLVPEEEPIQVFSHFQYLGSIVQSDCGMDSEINSRICKASVAFQSLSHILWLQRKFRSGPRYVS